MMENWKQLIKVNNISDSEVATAILKYLEENGPIKGLRFEQINALTILSDWEYITLGDKLEKIYQEVVEGIVGAKPSNKIQQITLEELK
ncbi:hypothetical protein J5O02_01250 [Streptococcus suis]|uniref:hypothetical protein n=1 Tax=Streptococcus suis TaxID=1307 RepID=UPI000CF6EF26|nr:hypothetical protein [Streptococcus suis]MBO3755702.1 hypothetical protein [Streptococcus suis]